MKEANEEKLDAARDGAAKTLNVESSTVGHGRVTKVEGEKEENQDTRMAEAPGETNLVEDYAKGKEKVIEANMVQIIIAGDKGKGKEKVNEANVVQKIIVRDNEHPETPETTRESLPENRHDQDNGKGTEKVNEAIAVQIIIIRDNEAQTLDAPPHAESSIAAERRLAKGEGEIQEEPKEGDRTTPESPNQELNPILYHAYNLVKNVKETCFIHRVHSGLRDGSEKHYKPVLVSIGPYHHGNPPVQDMETYKYHYMELLLLREEDKFERYVQALEDEHKQPRALDCYLDTNKMEKDTFAKSVVYDGCFLIELFRRNMKPKNYEDLGNDILFNIKWMKSCLERDMLLFENQIPLLVLRALFSLTDKTAKVDDFVPLVLGFFKFNGKQIPYDASLTNRLMDIPHLLGLVYEALVSCKTEEKYQILGGNKEASRSRGKEVLDSEEKKEVLEPEADLKTAQQLNNEGKSCEFIRTAVALEQVGVTFVREKDDVAFHEIKFSSGVLIIPRLVINHNTESFFRNLVAYEQYSKDNGLHRVVDYLHVMDCLINTSKDVEVLRHSGIIDNRIGDDAKVSAMFNYLCSNVYFDQDQFVYSKMFKDVNEFCRGRRNVWMAKLNNEYFGSPWSVISFIAAVLLLLFTATQTVYSVLSYYHFSS